MVSKPQIDTTCTVITQELVGGRRFLGRLLQTPKTLLIMKFTMEYESRYGYDVEDYPRLFQTYINSNLETVTADMNSRFLPVTNAQEVIIFATNEPTASPSLIGGNLSSMSSSFPSGNRPTSPSSSPPTNSAVPTFPPSTAPPPLSPTHTPSISPVFAPTSSPSSNGTLFIRRECNQVLEVETPEKFSDVQLGIYELLMQSYTEQFGFMVSKPQIVTSCKVITQELAGGRRLLSRLLQTPKTLLIMKFTMEYESRYGYDVEDYPRLFQTYINSNLETVTADMNSRFLPVTNAQEVIIFATNEPTASPSLIRGNHLPSISPSASMSNSPVFAPSRSSPTNGTLSVKRECNQILEVEKPGKFTEVQVGIYELLMQSYTAEFGFMVSTPQIVTTCEVITQELAGGRRLLSRLLQTPKTLLIMKFTMEYESRYGYDVEDYPRLFQTYINSNLETVTADMNSRFLPVTNAQEVIIFNTNEPTASPSSENFLLSPSDSPVKKTEEPNNGGSTLNSLFSRSMGRNLLFACASAYSSLLLM